jgi:F5/8 type C domain
MLTISSLLRRAALLTIATAVLGGCSSDGHNAGQGGLGKAAPIPEACSIPAAGCPCTSTESVKCGVTKSREGDTLTCREGERACTNGTWGDCIGDVTTQIYAPRPAPPGVHTQAQATMPADCNDACDPYCHKLADTPNDLPVTMPLIADPTGLSLYSAGFNGGNCPDVRITPDGPTLEIKTINANGTVTPSTVALHATCSAAATPIDPSWTADQPDRATVDIDGTFRAFSGIAGDVNVTASSVIDSAMTVVHVKVNINDTSAIDADPQAATIKAGLAGAGTANDPGKTLYPYKNTVFPLDLHAPLVQWQAGAAPLTPVTAANVEVALRYPAGSATPTFWYSKIFAGEPNDGTIQTTGAPSWDIPQQVWTAFARTAKGAGAEIIIQRRTAATVYKEMIIPVTFSTAALRGTVYYTQYERRLWKPDPAMGDPNVCGSGQPDLPATFNPLDPGTQVCPVGNCTHADEIPAGSTTRAIDLSNPAATNSDPIGTGGCPVCHSVSANGNRYVAGSQFLQTWATGTSTGFVADITANASGAAQFSIAGVAPNYSSFPTATDWDSRGFSYAALTPDGEFALQGPYSWGNTKDTTSATDNLTTAKPLQSGGQTLPMFFVPTVNTGANVRYATTAALAATRSGNVLTGSGGILTVDGATPAVGDSVLVKNQTDKHDNGIYLVTDVGSGPLASGDLTSSTSLAAGASSTTQAASLAFDNDYGTRWESNSSDPQWLQVDLGSTQSVNRVRIEWEVASAQDYTIAVSDDAATWTTISTQHNTSSANHRVDDLTGLTGMGRYVRMRGTTRTTGWGYSIYEFEVFGPTPGAPFQLTRRSDAVDPATADGAIKAGSEVRVTRGDANYSKIFKLTAPATDPVKPNTNRLTYVDTGADPLPVMMTPTISPDGKKIAYVNGDTDTYPASDSAAWRKSLTTIDFDQATRKITNKKRILNNWDATTGGSPIKWPFFESDSHSLLFVQSTPDNYCRDGDTSNDNGRGCKDSTYGGMAPTSRGRWPGSLYSIDATAATPATTKVELATLNDAENAWDADKAFQPTSLKDPSGGFRWVIFTSPRSYGNQLNQLGATGPTHFSCGATMLWVAALDDKDADGTDRSHPAFFLPGQQALPIKTKEHFVNERGYLVPSPCKASASTCSSSDECCSPSVCKVDSIPMSGVPIKKCKDPAACGHTGDTCLTAADCCGTGSSCVNQKCASVPNYMSSGTYTRDYEAKCEPGFKPRWGLFSFHLSTPSTSEIAFAAKTATTSADLPAGVPITLGTSTADNYGMAPASYDVGAKLEAANVQYSLAFLRVLITLTPSTGGAVAPILHDWEQRYSCVPAE